ncbi:D-glycero-alpha-D-manno-heptose 1-phosphate guanylyltransferase [Bradyrhizobium japonicum]|uniref:sugar phosphate nucleotidyltransferase n=1 Tax=Bradyrhizobium japonicum TaxID=375 RepID=UPI0033944DE7
MQAVILAGGKGTRLRDTVPDLPKPLAPVGGRPFLEHQMAYWSLQGVNRFVLSVGYKAAMIIDRIGARFGDAEVLYAVEDEPLGTGGALIFAKQKLTPNEPFLVVNGDTFFDLPLADLETAHTEKDSDWTFGLFPTRDTKRFLGVNLTATDRLVSLVAPVVEDLVWANGGVYMIAPGVLDRVATHFKGQVSLEAEIIPALLKLQTVMYGVRHTGRFIDIGIPEDYRRAADVLGSNALS